MQSFSGRSIAHNLAYEAADIAIDNENLQVEVLQPTVTFVSKSNSQIRDMRSRNVGKRSSKSQKAQQKRLEMETKPPPCSETKQMSSPHIIGAPNNGESMKPPKLESMCNCVIM
ncbi:UNVERIFIED_CONTAM: hypothetical protein Sradi_1785800 [Sesamum radiatum]|uniref:Uncharacterized protein n=1 Tax=Sesamum radiatum TaxID=300843 RepID=A0AAW2TVL3_SESRA